MKTLLKPVAAMMGLILIAANASAQLPNQPPLDAAARAALPATSDFGAFATIDSTVVAPDPDRAVAYDNFMLSDDYEINGVCWTGIYAEPFPPNPLSTTDFLITIYEDDGMGAPDLGSVAATWTLDGGLAGTDGPDVDVTSLGYTSPVTPSNPFGGGQAFDYEASLNATAITAGNYWISITALQDFATPILFDPEWMWHLGTGPADDGFFAFDAQFPPPAPNDMDPGVLIPDKDLAFQLKGVVIPEPSSMLMALVGIISLGLFRRKR